MNEVTKAQADKRERLRNHLADKVAGDRSWEARGTVIPIRAHGSQPPLFCVLGGGAGIVSYRKLAELLPADRPVMGLQLQGLRTDAQISRSIERMAEEQLAALLAAHPAGPCCLCGHSLGGVVALEIAQQLIRSGRQVPLLVVIDQPGPGIRLKLSHWFYWQWVAVSHLPWRLRWRYVWEGARFRIRSSRFLPRWLKRVFTSNRGNVISPGAGNKHSNAEFRINIVESSIDALRKYQAHVFPSKMVLVRAQSSAPRIHSDPWGGWQMVSQGGIRVFDIPGDHMNVFESPNIEALAKCITESLELIGDDESVGSKRA